MKTTNYIVKRGPLAALFIMFIVFYACSDDGQPQKQKAEVTDFPLSRADEIRCSL